MDKEKIISDIIQEAEKSNDVWTLDPDMLLDKYLRIALGIAEQENE